MVLVYQKLRIIRYISLVTEGPRGPSHAAVLLFWPQIYILNPNVAIIQTLTGADFANNYCMEMTGQFNYSVMPNNNIYLIIISNKL